MSKEMQKIRKNSLYGMQVTEKFNKEKSLQFIKNFSSIKLTEILKKYKIDSSNFYHGKISEEKVILIKNEIDSEICKLYFDRIVGNESKN